ncbi:DNA adenine methylase [Flavobacterium sp. LC2016-23]|uniref:DNA adenine methylase n=1 Tax=Flavobacterium sp. LC2016-23 TaxID=2666330 RepID=UPI0012B04CF3|nr:DNA adenine methylase [Flavobacterium sp. LC2016-23]MRX40598.1 DNA adenine methylase [Flavobacterium sp. LC2016-23]
MSGNKNKLIAFNYFGGKFTWLDYLYAYFPNDFVHLAELFGGSMAVSLNYQGKCIKTVNEINGDVTNFFEVLRDDTENLIMKLELSPCSEENYNQSWPISGDKTERARKFYVRARQSFYGLGAQRENKSWHMAKTKLNAQVGETVSKWNNALPKLLEVARVIRVNFQIIKTDALIAILKLDSAKTFFYLDPPYLLETRGSSNDYMFEFSEEKYREMAAILYKIKGYAMISGYDHPLMKELFEDKGWIKIKFPTKRNNIRSKQVTECIWINYPLSKTNSNNGKQSELLLKN